MFGSEERDDGGRGEQEAEHDGQVLECEHHEQEFAVLSQAGQRVLDELFGGILETGSHYMEGVMVEGGQGLGSEVGGRGVEGQLCLVDQEYDAFLQRQLYLAVRFLQSDHLFEHWVVDESAVHLELPVVQFHVGLLEELDGTCHLGSRGETVQLGHQDLSADGH